MKKEIKAVLLGVLVFLCVVFWGGQHSVWEIHNEGCYGGQSEVQCFYFHFIPFILIGLTLGGIITTLGYMDGIQDD
jgi:hypothetical protein